MLGVSRPGDMGFDIVHFNTHKTFSTPHGGGGPGAGPIVVRDSLAPFLPVPLVEKGEDGRFFFQYDRPQSIGKVRTFYGNFGVLVRAWTYIRSLGAEGLREVSETAVLNANYVMEGLRGLLDLPYGDRRCMHEFVGSATPLKQDGVRALDVAKRLLDYGVHPPTTYFPLIVDEALMVEPTETESKDALDRLVEAFRSVAREARDQPAAAARGAGDAAGAAARRSAGRPPSRGEAAVPGRRGGRRLRPRPAPPAAVRRVPAAPEAPP